ncbi:MAG: lipopolysaccharide A protein [Gammaproteobacteria bacterium]|nr:lipopolysaccharide A protein [Gammaproteobacteria bacterium]
MRAEFQTVYRSASLHQIKEAESRAAYYCQLDQKFSTDDPVCDVKSFKLGSHHSAYYFDAAETLRLFPDDWPINYIFGDVNYNPENPCFTKSRPIKASPQNAILLNLDRYRHFNFISDHVEYSDKADKVVWRGQLHNDLRKQAVRNFATHPKVDFGTPDKKYKNDPAYLAAMSRRELLESKWILSLEGYDVATSTAWILGTNSVCIMPEPRFETWFMHGKLIPDTHFARVSPDLADLNDVIEKLQAEPKWASNIIKAANSFQSQFQDPIIETLSAYLTAKLFFELSGQSTSNLEF